MKRIAVVILNWNGKNMLAEYLPSVVEHSSTIADIVVADNGSTDGSVEYLAHYFPEVSTVVLDKNYGFAGGYNRALKQLAVEYIVLLNSDVEVENNWLTPLLSFMENTPCCAACQPKIIALSDRSSFEYAGASGGFIDRYGYPFCRGRIFDNVEKDNGQYDTVSEISWATGACMMIRSRDFFDAGGFDERFFAHCEEIDLCWRLRLFGRKIYCVPRSRVFHLGGGTLPNSSPQKTFLNFRNSLTMLYKNLDDATLRRVLVVRSILDRLAALHMLVVGRNVEGFKAVLRARKAFREWRDDFAADRESIALRRRSDVGSGLCDVSVLWQYYVRRRKTFGRLCFPAK